MSWQNDLSEIISSYFADASAEEGAQELALVSECDPGFHQRILMTFQYAIEAASHGQAEIVNLLRDNLILHVDSTEKAKDYLERVLTAYMGQYRAATGEEP